MEFVKYLWFIVIPVGIAIVWSIRFKKKFAAMGESVSTDIIRHARITMTVSMVLCAGSIGTIQLIGDIENPFYVYSANLDNPYVVMAKSVLGLFWVALNSWAWMSSQFNHYVIFILPRFLMFLRHIARPVVSIVSTAGMALLILFPGNTVPLFFTNQSAHTVEWINVYGGKSDVNITDLQPQGRQSKNLKLKQDLSLVVEYKLANNENAFRGELPFVIDEFFMGLIRITITKDGKLVARDHSFLDEED